MPKVRNEEGLYIGSLYTSEEQCAWPSCESWRTLKIEFVGHHEGEVALVRFPLCREHFFEFIEKYVFNSEKNIVLRRDGTVEE